MVDRNVKRPLFDFTFKNKVDRLGQVEFTTL